MKFTLVIVLSLLILMSFNVSAASGKITYTEIEDLTYQFDFTVGNATSYRWTFGDGSSSTAISPVHEYGNHKIYSVNVDVTLSNGSSVSDSITLDANLPIVDDETGNVNVGDVSVPGGLLFLSCFLMFALATGNNHIGADILGKGGKDVLMFFYSLGMIVGGYLIFTSLYGGI